MERAGLPELMGFAFTQMQGRAELLMSHCGADLNKEWEKYMLNRKLAKSTELKLKICDMARQVLSSLDCLHKQGYCHWDIKLDNICFRDGYYYLIDFALAQRTLPFSKGSIKKGSFKGNSMFASMRKFKMSAPAYPIDDIESLLYLVCFCYDEFYLPWLQDYMN
jgi:serine/threonine protein kinase